MKITSIASICKKRKYVALLERYNELGEIVRQYISDGSAIYPIDGLPYLTSDNILTIFDIPEKQRSKWVVQTQVAVPGIYSTEDTYLREKQLVRESIQIVYGSVVLRPLQTTYRGLVFIDNKYLSPLTDVLDVLELFERYTPDGDVYIVAKAGLLLQAIIAPVDIVDEQFITNMENLTLQCRQALRYKDLKVRAAEPEPEQISIDTDPETGEVINFDDISKAIDFGEENEDD